jgi:hypothetical protein
MSKIYSIYGLTKTGAYRQTDMPLFQSIQMLSFSFRRIGITFSRRKVLYTTVSRKEDIVIESEQELMSKYCCHCGVRNRVVCSPTEI